MADIPQKRASKIDEKFVVEENTLKRAVNDNPKDKIEIEIGDAKQPDFKPQAKIMRWDNEVNFSLRAQEHPDATVKTEGKLIKYITPDYEVHQYELDPGEIGEDGGLEFEWVLPKKPASNVLTATIQTKELDFFYQTPLTKKQIDDGASRPENVEGSYAVYHKTKGGMNRADGMEYKTGKAFHIYRPKVTDADKNETWAELNIDEASGVLSVTVPQEFLDKAVYPVIVDPTFGYTSAGATKAFYISFKLSSNYFNYTIGRPYNLSSNGILTKITASFSTNSGSSSGNASAAIYRENSAGSGSHDLVKLIERTDLTFDTSTKTYDFTASSDFLSADDYILAIIGDSQSTPEGYSIYLKSDDVGSSKNNYEENTTGSGGYATRKAENPWTETASSSNWRDTVYATYEAVPKTETLTDNFDDNSINATIWNDDHATETGGQMVINAATGEGTNNGIASDNRYDLTSSYALIELVSAGDTSLSFTTYILELYNDTVDLYWGIEYGATDEIVAYKSPNSVDYTEIYRATYDSGVHKWFRIREASGTVYWDTSADGENWTNRDSDATGYTLTALNVFFGVENPGSGSTSVVFDNFNVPPVTTNSERDSIVTGKDTANSARAAHTLGEANTIYTKEVKASLPTTDTSLQVVYTSQQITDVATDDATRVPLTATSTDFMVHHYKYYYSTESADQFTVTWNGQSTLAPSSATVYLQVYNHNTPGWETIDSDNATAANTDFDLSATVSTNLAYYYDAYYIVTCRVYQEIT